MRPLFPADAGQWPPHPQPAPVETAPPQSLPATTLRPSHDGDLPILEQWIAIPDVHEFLEYDQPPNRHSIKLALLGRQLEVQIVEHAGRPVGFFALYFRGLAAGRTREFDIAIPERGARQQGLAKSAIRALEDWAFEKQQLNGVWAKIFTNNVACLELVRACGWPLSGVHEGALDFRGEERDLVYTWMTPALREDARRRRGF